jgi:hypothetical protein
LKSVSEIASQNQPLGLMGKPFFKFAVLLVLMLCCLEKKAGSGPLLKRTKDMYVFGA